MGKEHWCITKNCRHGTLNGSLQYGSILLNEFNIGFAAGREQALKDLFETYFTHHDTIEEDDEWCMKHLPSVQKVFEVYTKANDYPRRESKISLN